MSQYILESECENERLEKQSKNPNYSYQDELAGFTVRSDFQILDAGCGSGVVMRYLAERDPTLKLVGIDQSESRIAFAQKVTKETCPNASQISFLKGDLGQLPFGDHHFDRIICRYVLQHIPRAHLEKVMKEFFRCLKSGGELWVVDFDGLFLNLYPQSEFIRKILSDLDESALFEFKMGRKLNSLFYQAGFKDLNGRVNSLDFSTAESLNEEVEMTESRLENAVEVLGKYLGSIDLAKKFNKEFIESMKSSGAFYFYDKMIVKGIKPRLSTLKRVI